MGDVHIDLEKMQPVTQVTEKVKGLTNEKPTFRICENKCADQLRSNFYACTARFVSDLFVKHIVGFLMTRLKMLSATN